MKTMKDIEKMKCIPVQVFGTQYDYLVELLFDWHIAKTDGKKRIQLFLKDWDTESKEYWIEALKCRIKKEEEIFYGGEYF